MNIRFSASKEAKETQDMVNLRIEAASVSRHRSSNQISEGSKVTGIIADNQIHLYVYPLFCQKIAKRSKKFGELSS